MKRNILFIFLLIASHVSFMHAQEILVSGTVKEAQSENPLEFVSVVLVDVETNLSISGTTTDSDGKFTLESETKDFYIEVSFIGFETVTIKEFNIKNNTVKLGDVILGAQHLDISEVVVSGKKSTTEFKLDKRVFNVGQDLSSSGAGALEVLNNVPSVKVDIEGQISLRGNTGVQILINGKPSVLADDQGGALGSITAEMIERVEVITNPSAKYEAEGTAGIINIVIKKEEREGANGSVSLNVGWPHNHSVGLSLNKRTERFNLFTQLGAGYRSLPRYGESINEDKINHAIVESDGTYYRNENFYNIRLGTDYYIDKLNILTLSGNFAYEIENQPSEVEFYSRDKNGETKEWKREEDTEALNPKWQYELQYKKNFENEEDRFLLISAIGNSFSKKLDSEFNTENLVDLVEKQRSHMKFSESKYTFNADYSQPFQEEYIFETGAQYVIQNVKNDYGVDDYQNSEWIENEDYTDVFNYDQDVLGVYVTGAYEGKRWGLKLGSRVEWTDLDTELERDNKDNDQNYGNFFPSVHTSYKFSDRFSLQVGYSRRIYRPRLWDLNPFFNVSNNFSVWSGNPELNPEFSDSYEVTGIYILDYISLNLSVFHLYTTDLIERVSFFENNVNTRKPINIGTNNSTGVDLNFKYPATDWLTFNGELNYNFNQRKGQFNDKSFDFTAHKMTSQLTSKIDLPQDFDIEITGNYQSPYQQVQSVQAQNIYADLGLRKKFRGGKMVLNLSVRDVFASRFREAEIDEPEYYLYNHHSRGRFATLGFSYGFGKGEAMQYSGSRR